VVKAPSLLDRGTTHETEDDPTTINTASGSLPVRAAGDFLAKLTPPGARGISPRPIVVRAPALLVPGLRSPNLIPVSLLAESEGVSVLFDDDGANLTFADIDGNSVTVTFPCRDGTYGAKVQPLTASEMRIWRAHFARKPGESVQVALASDVHKITPQDGAAAAVTRSQRRVSLAPEAGATDSPQDQGPSPPPTEGSSSREDLSRLLHVRYGHASPKRLAEAIASGSLLVPEIRDKDSPASKRLLATLATLECPECAGGATPRLPRVHPRRVANDLLPWQIVHFDTIPMSDSDARSIQPTKPLDDFLPDPTAKHMLLAVDECTRYALTVPCTAKDNATYCAAFCELDTNLRCIMRKAREVNPAFADANGYTQARIDDTATAVIRHVHSDNANEFLHCVGAWTRPGVHHQEDRDPVGVFTRVGTEPYIVTHGPFRQGGAPHITTSDPQRPRENGLPERKHRSSKALATTLLISGGFGWKGYSHAYPHAVMMENLLTTTIPVPGTRDTVRGVPFERALGFSYDAKARPLFPFGALSFPLASSSGKGKFSFKRSAGLYLGRTSYPSRDHIVALTNKHGNVNVTSVGPEIKVLEAHFHRNPASARHLFLRNQRHSFAPDQSAGDIPPEDLLVDAAGEGDASPLDLDPEEELDVPLELADDFGDDEPSFRAVSPPPEVPTTPALSALPEPTDLVDSFDDATFFTAEEFSDSPGEEEEVTSPLEEVMSPLEAAVYSGIACWAMSPRALPRQPASTGRAPAALAIRPSEDGAARKELADFSASEVKAAVLAEYSSLLAHSVFAFAVRPKGAPLLDTKMVLKVRNNNTLKARLTARGFLQRALIDYFETYAPVATPMSIRTVVALGASFGTPLHTADAESAYLQAAIEEDLYLDLPRVRTA